MCEVWKGCITDIDFVYYITPLEETEEKVPRYLTKEIKFFLNLLAS